MEKLKHKRLCCSSTASCAVQAQHWACNDAQGRLLAFLLYHVINRRNPPGMCECIVIRRWARNSPRLVKDASHVPHLKLRIPTCCVKICGI